jgi:23S rRNA pseudouridine1911/1915/1917 synthase
MNILVVDENKDNIRIDKYISEQLNISRSKVQKLLENGNVKVDDKIVKNNYIVKVDDNIIIDEELNQEINILPENIPLDIYYEDDDVLVVNKPRGMVVHPACGHYSNTLVNALLYHCNNLSGVNGNVRPGIVHRIDKDTSGLLLVAKNDDAHIKLADLLQQRKIERRYIALVSGVINHDTGTVDAPIGRDKNDRKKMIVTDVNAKEAITNFRVIERLNNATLIECKLETGRTHQIRVHMQYINYPIINDPLYGPRKLIDDKGQMLHATVLGFNHPTTNEYLEFKAPIPEEMIKIIDMYKNK